VGEPDRRRLIEEVAAVYEWIDAQLRQHAERAGRCNACGACCDFATYDHRLFVTTPELMYLATGLNAKELKQMSAGRCPYQKGYHELSIALRSFNTDTCRSAGAPCPADRED